MIKGNLNELFNRSSKISEAQIRVIAAQIIQCLNFMHLKGIIYGDLKIENILLSKDGIVKLCDFNLSGTESVLNSSMQGTLCYLAPEMIMNSPRTKKSDFWALGVLLYYLFFEQFPFQNNSSSSLIQNILNKKIHKFPNHRLATSEFKKLLYDLLIKNSIKRLGNEIEDFHQHPFFESFDWDNYLEKEENFLFAKSSGVYESSESSSNEEISLEVLHQSKELKIPKNYNIDGFTYENSQSKKNTLVIFRNFIKL